MCVMAAELANVLRLTPKIEELLPNYVNEIKCTEADCKSTFRNNGNYLLHMVQHHRKPTPMNKLDAVYHCPVEKCIYHISQLSKRCCTSLSLIRQHYRKVHLPKDFVCEDCGKAFLKDSELQKHQTNGTCGYVWICDECGWKYGSREALLTHVKRKGHKSENAVVPAANKTVAQAKLPKKRSATMTENETPKLQCVVRPIMSAVQRTALEGTENHMQTDMAGDAVLATDNVDSATLQDLNNDIDIATLLCNMETRTNQHAASTSTTPADTHTQTHGDLLKELDLVDHTETSSTGTTTVSKKLYDGSTFLISWPAIMNDDLRVSTATQTSFEQYLLSTELGLTHITAETQTEVQPEYTTAETQTRETPYLILSDVTLEPPAAPVPEETSTIEPVASNAEPASDVVLSLSSADVLVTSETQTSLTQCLLNTQLSLVDMETQTNFDYTEPAHGSADTATTAAANQSVSNCLRLDDFLVSTETQTSYEQCLLNTDLTLADIETQTNWSYNEPEQEEVFNDNNTPASMLEATKACGVLTLSCHDYLVSTETQTNFAQNLRLNTNDTISNDGLYTTQYTQTCDELLNELWFGDQENFQSVYTQT